MPSGPYMKEQHKDPRRPTSGSPAQLATTPHYRAKYSHTRNGAMAVEKPAQSDIKASEFESRDGAQPTIRLLQTNTGTGDYIAGPWAATSLRPDPLGPRPRKWTKAGPGLSNRPPPAGEESMVPGGTSRQADRTWDVSCNTNQSRQPRAGQDPPTQDPPPRPRARLLPSRKWNDIYRLQNTWQQSLERGRVRGRHHRIISRGQWAY